MNYKNQIQNLKDTNQYRYLKDISHLGDGFVEYNGKKLLNLSSNDYIGISQNKELVKEFFEQLNTENQYLLGSASSRLLSGNYTEYTELENTIAKAYNKEAALIYNSGYHANTGVLPALSTKNDLILSDKLNHASIVDGLKNSKANVIRYKHFDYNQIEKYLETNRNNFKNVFIVTETIFSMDGDIADVDSLIKIKKKYNCFLYIDEAHAIGAYGNNGLGVCEQNMFYKDIDIILGTFGKALGSVGAFVALNNSFKEILINKSRTLIYTTGLPLINIKWTSFIFKKLQVFKQERVDLVKLSEDARGLISKNKLQSAGNTYIIPVIIGDNKLTLELAEILLNEGYYVSAVRHPTVPKGTARIRLSLNSKLKFNDVENVIQIIADKTL